MKDKHRILLLGMNYASTLNSLAEGFTENNQHVESISFELNRSKYNSYSWLTCVYPEKKINRFLFKWYTLKGIIKLITKIRKCDVIHVYSDIQLNTKYQSFILDFIFNKIAAKKKKYVTFVGSEVRIPEIEFELNKFYKSAFQSPQYEYKHESRECSYSYQEKFFNWGFKLLCSPDTAKYINKDFFNSFPIINHAGFSAVERSVSDPKVIHIIHAPSAPFAKGSNIIREKMVDICKKYKHVKFVEIQNVSNIEYQEYLSCSTLLIDQIIWGYYGVATIQAMAIGLPVACFINDDLNNYIRVDKIPIININPENFIDQISTFIENPDIRNQLSHESKAFFLKNHLPAQVAKELLQIYLE